MLRTCLSKAVFFPPSTTATSGIPPCTSPPPPSEHSLVSWCPAMLASAAAPEVDEGRKDSISRAKLTDSPDHIFKIGALVFSLQSFCSPSIKCCSRHYVESTTSAITPPFTAANLCARSKQASKAAGQQSVFYVSSPPLCGFQPSSLAFPRFPRRGVKGRLSAGRKLT